MSNSVAKYLDTRLRPSSMEEVHRDGAKSVGFVVLMPRKASFAVVGVGGGGPVAAVGSSCCDPRTDDILGTDLGNSFYLQPYRYNCGVQKKLLYHAGSTEYCAGYARMSSFTATFSPENWLRVAS